MDREADDFMTVLRHPEPGEGSETLAGILTPADPWWVVDDQSAVVECAVRGNRRVQVWGTAIGMVLQADGSANFVRPAGGSP